MNLILFSPDELSRPLPRGDRRAKHLLEVLRRQPGDTFDAGLVNGPRGKGRLQRVTDDAIELSFTWGPRPEAAPAITLIVGLPRPQTARDILRDATTLGVSAIHFITTEKSERSYAQSSLWTTDEWRRHLVTGAEQAFDPQVPEVTWTHRLPDVTPSLGPDVTRLAFDNYEGSVPFGSMTLPPANGDVLALGSERGWSAAEREVLRAQGFTLVHLGARVLRAETAIVSALTLLRAKRGLM